MATTDEPLLAALMRYFSRCALACFCAVAVAVPGGQAQMARETTAGPAFEVTIGRPPGDSIVTGRVYVALSRVSTSQEDPIAQTGPTGVPLFGVDVSELSPGKSVVVDASSFGHPIRSLRDLAAGDYWAQPFVNVYTRFRRADGHTLWLHMDQWEGQDWKRSPGNLYGEPVRVHLEPGAATLIRLVADRVIPPIVIPPDSANVRRIKIRSDILTRWWGHPIYLGAVVLLPKGYDEHPNVKYPIVYDEGHFSLDPPDVGSTAYWNAEGTPRMIVVTLQHPSPYYDDSYGVNSANNGPYSDAIMRELIPAVESRFRVIGQPWARLLTGGSTGGWIALAKQVMYPDFYGGAWSLCPDGVDFRYHQIVNVYADSNAYWLDRGWMKIDRPAQRRPDGNILAMMKDENWYELAVGDHSRSGGQWDIWEATFSPVGPDGYPKHIWDKQTGVIDKSVAAYWKEHYDLRAILQTNWPTLGPKLAGKLNVYVGDEDSYFLNMGVHLLEEFLRSTTSPRWTGEIVFQPMAPHCWGPRMPQLMDKMAAHIGRTMPAGTDGASWRY